MVAVAKPPLLKWLLPWVGLVTLVVTLVVTLGYAAPIVDCNRSNCQFNVKDECQRSITVNCNLRKQPIEKINITKTSFPKQVSRIAISNVQAIEIQADAIAFLASLESIKLDKIDTLTLLPRSLARTRESGSILVTIQHVTNLQLHPETFADLWSSGSKITIDKIENCHMSRLTIAPSTLISSLYLLRITNLTIDQEAFAPDSVIENMLLADVTSLTVKTGAFAPNTTVQFMALVHIEAIKLHTGAFARNSCIQNVEIDKVTSLLIDSGGIQADISKLTISDVSMPTCEDNTFGSSIQDMSFVSSNISLMKSGCISASAGWKNIVIEKSQCDHVESLAIRGTIEQVHIKDSDIGIVDTGGFTLNVTSFTVEGSTIGELSEKALAVSAAEVITLNKCEVAILRKHAFSLLQLDTSAKVGIRIENLRIQVMENESMQFAPRANVVVSQLELGINCTCDMEKLVLELGLPSIMQPGHGNDSKTSRWLEQTRCVSNTIKPTLAKYHQEYCLDPTTIPPSTTITNTNSGGRTWQRNGSPTPAYTVSPRESQGSRLTRTGSVNAWGVFVITFGCAIPIVTLVIIWWRKNMTNRSRYNTVRYDTVAPSKVSINTEEPPPEEAEAGESKEQSEGSVLLDSRATLKPLAFLRQRSLSGGSSAIKEGVESSGNLTESD